MKRFKISIIGVGQVGTACAHWAAAAELGDLVLLDHVPGQAEGRALDLRQTLPLLGRDVEVLGTTDFDATADSDVVILTAGLARKPGMSRDDLLADNAKTVAATSRETARCSPAAKLIVVANPVDAMTWVAQQASGFLPKHVFGLSGVLDTARLRSFIAEELRVSASDVTALVVGGHGDQMVPLVRQATVGGVALGRLLPPERLAALVERTRHAGAEILGQLKNASSSCAPGAAIAEMAEAIVRDRKRILPCAAWCTTEYGAGGCYVGVPVKLGADGVEQIIEVEFDAAERAVFEAGLGHTKALIQSIRL
jgi:malate dehydrogenase